MKEQVKVFSGGIATMQNEQITDLRNQIKDSICRNSDGGYIPYKGCLVVCTEMMSVVQLAKVNINPKRTFDIYIMILLEAVRLFFYADTSSGAATEVVRVCLTGIGKLCKAATDDNEKYFFNTIIKSVQIKAFKDWADYGYKLLKYATYFVHDQVQAQKVYNVFQVLGTMYDGKDYPDKFLITFSIIGRLEGKKAANKYLMENTHVPVLRSIAVENSLMDKNYPLAEILCIEALKKNRRGHFNKFSIWAYYLERLYVETSNKIKLREIVCYILFHGDIAYYKKIKALYQKEGIWEQKREQLLWDLSKALKAHRW